VQPAPFAYVGKVTRGDIGYAVLAREERVFVVRPGDTVERYRVQSISEKEVVILSIDSGATRSLAFTAGAASSLLSAAAAGIGSIDEVSLRVSAPTQVAVGEQFTLTVSLDSGMSVVLETGRVEVRFDPKVLEIPGQSASSGAARLEIFGAYAGHPRARHDPVPRRRCKRPPPRRSASFRPASPTATDATSASIRRRRTA